MEKEPIKIELREDKIIEILLHAATREDLARLDAKLDSGMAKLDAKIDSGMAKLDAKIDSGLAKLDAKIDSRIDKVDTKIDRITWMIVASLLIPILLHFIK